MTAVATREPGSVWQQQLPPRAARPALSGEVSADVVIIGAGFTGLWTAYYLGSFAPHLRIVVIEAEQVGYGASGRNGGWCTTEMPALLLSLVRRYGPVAAMRFFRTARKTLDEVERVLTAESIDAGFARDGSLYVARTRPQEDRLRGWQDMRLQLGITDMKLLEPAAIGAYAQIEGARLAGFTPHCAVLQPAALAAGLAVAVERRGVTIAEHTRAVGVTTGTVTTGNAVIKARSVLTATEAYTGGLPGHGRRILPVISRAIATEPLSPELWARLGWQGRVSVADSRHQFAYFHRTADDRLVIGGRGAGYRAGSSTSPAGRYGRQTFARLQSAATEMFPALAGQPISHRWSGAYGLHRDSEPAVVYHPESGLGHAGGYSGEGIALSNLAGRAVAALVSGISRPEARLFWTGHRSRRWEPEPLRFLGVRGVSALGTLADRYEDRTDRAAPLAGLILRAVL